VWYNCWVVPMGIRFRSYSVYGLGYCPTMSWSAIITVNSVCDTYTSFATRLCFDLYTFLEIFGWVWLWSLCVRQFWACKFTVSLCILLSVQRSEVKWGEVMRDKSDDILESPCGGVCIHQFDRMIFLVILWRSVNASSLIVWRRRRSWCTLMSDHSIVEWGVGLADDQTAACRSVSPYRRLLQSAILHTKELCRIYMTVFSDRQFVVCGMIVCIVWARVFFEFMLYTMLRM